MSNQYRPSNTNAGKRHRIGFYGCCGQLVSIAYRAHTYPPHHIDVHCPACGMKHKATPTWRVSKKPGELDNTDLRLRPTPPPAVV